MSSGFRVPAASAVLPPLSTMSDSDDDVPTLSAHTLAALQEFYNETSGDAGSSPSDHFSVGALEEDWVSEVDLVPLHCMHKWCRGGKRLHKHGVRVYKAGCYSVTPSNAFADLS